MFRPEAERRVELSDIERSEILKSSPSSQDILHSAYFDNWDLPCPVRVDLDTGSVVLRKSRSQAVESEVAVLEALRAYGLPVPEVLRQPFRNEEGGLAAVYSLLPGQNLQKLSSQSPEGLLQAKDLLVHAVSGLSEATAFMRGQDLAAPIPSLSLAAEWDALSSAAHPWLQEQAFQGALKRLEAPLRAVTTPLVFSNGDYQPGNFMAEGAELSGFLDFEACVFQDPLMGMVKYPIDDLYPLCRSDLIRLFLQENGFSKEDFGLRLALGCLKKLKKDVPISGGNEKERKRVLELLGMSWGPMKHENLLGLGIF